MGVDEVVETAIDTAVVAVEDPEVHVDVHGKEHEGTTTKVDAH